MKIALFTGNQPRHLSLARNLASIADEVFCINECTRITHHAPIVQGVEVRSIDQYYGRMVATEREVFGPIDFLPQNVRQISLARGDLDKLNLDILAPILNADHVIIFGASYIKGQLIEHLIERKAINIHMGISPYYRGSACNFWALYDGNADLVGATIHQLSRGLDSGDILFHVKQHPVEVDPFLFGMLAVKAAHKAVLMWLADGQESKKDAMPQKPGYQIRYSKGTDFDEMVAHEFLERDLTAYDIGQMLANNLPRDLIEPIYV